MLRKSFFAIDSEGEPLFQGYTDGRTWNGWAHPYFTKEVGILIVKHFLELGYSAWYDEKEDAFNFVLDGSVNNTEDIDSFSGKDFIMNGETIRLYPIGSGCWVWSEFDENDNRI